MFFLTPMAVSLEIDLKISCLLKNSHFLPTLMIQYSDTNFQFFSKVVFLEAKGGGQIMRQTFFDQCFLWKVVFI